MASREQETKGMLRIIHSDGRSRNRMFCNRIDKAIGKSEIPKELQSDERFEELIDKINRLAIINLVYIERFTYFTILRTRSITSPFLFCYDEVDLMALKLGLDND